MKGFHFLPHGCLHPSQQARPQPYPQHKEKGYKEKGAMKKTRIKKTNDGLASLVALFFQSCCDE
jgi:hypothetical protein